MRHLLSAAGLFFFTALPIAAEPCQSILSDFSFCPTASWDRLDLDLPRGVMVWQNGPVVAKVIVEAHAAGTAPDADTIVTTIMESVRSSLPDPAAVMFTEHDTSTDSDLDLGILAYDLDLRGQTVKVHHSFMVSEQITLQFLTSTGSLDDTANLDAHRDFLSTFRMEEPSQAI